MDAKNNKISQLINELANIRSTFGVGGITNHRPFVVVYLATGVKVETDRIRFRYPWGEKASDPTCLNESPPAQLMITRTFIFKVNVGCIFHEKKFPPSGVRADMFTSGEAKKRDEHHDVAPTISGILPDGDFMIEPVDVF
ncbi:hypothetical protein HUJ04_002811 [Dendroctonus ponderosae]|nr:hypothetical protein HUJ04_002811 [Dendroctonus ponderosae]